MHYTEEDMRMFAKYDLCNLRKNFARRKRALKMGMLVLEDEYEDDGYNNKEIDFEITIGIEPGEKLSTRYCDSE